MRRQRKTPAAGGSAARGETDKHSVAPIYSVESRFATILGEDGDSLAVRLIATRFALRPRDARLVAVLAGIGEGGA
jgi:hypothetical protein